MRVIESAHERHEVFARAALAELGLAVFLAKGVRGIVELLGVRHGIVEIDEDLLPREQKRELLLRRLLLAAVEDLFDEMHVVQLQRTAQRLRVLLELAVDLHRTLYIRIRIHTIIMHMFSSLSICSSCVRVFARALL